MRPRSLLHADWLYEWTIQSYVKQSTESTDCDCAFGLVGQAATCLHRDDVLQRVPTGTPLSCELSLWAHS